MTLEESEAEADRLLSEAGWTTTLKPPWNGRHVAPGLVGGRAPDGNAYAKAYTAFAQSEAAAMGLDPALYPDEPHEAAAVLVASVLVTQPEASETPQDETHGETGEAAQGGDGAEDIGLGDQHAGQSNGQYVDEGVHTPAADDVLDLNADIPDEPVPEEPRDADYTGELPEIELIPPDPDPDFGAELLEYEGELADAKEEAPTGAFIFGDNLDQKRTAAIGLVVQIALQKMPDWPPELDARLGELRNFAAGVGEGRFTNNDELQAELKAIEARLSLRRSIEEVRDKKVGALVAANREQIEAFDPEAGWP